MLEPDIGFATKSHVCMSGSGIRTVCSNRTWFELSHFHVRFEHPHYVLEPEVLKPDMAMSGLSTRVQIHVRFELPAR